MSDKGRDRDVSAIDEHLSLFLAKFVPRMRRNCYFRFPSFRSNHDTAVAFGDPDFLYGTDILVISGHKLPYDLDI